MATKHTAVDISNDDAALLAAREKAIASLGTGNAVAGVSPDAQVFTLPDGREVVMSPPQGGIARKLAVMLGGESGHIGLLMNWAKAMMFVRSVGGNVFPVVSTVVDAQRIADALGAVGEELVMSAYQDFWPAVDVKDLQTIKK